MRQQVSGWLREGRQEGCSALVVLRERVGRLLDESVDGCVVESTCAREKRGRGVATSQGRRARVPQVAANTCRALAALGHVQRSKIMGKLLDGPATYGTLQKITKLKAGPLYHHINQLRLAGLMLPKQRDLYELTRGGRNLILITMTMGGLIRDTKRRPVGTE